MSYDYGEPEDVPGECNAWLFIFDNFGDNHCTLRCQLPEGHEGPHQEKFRQNDTGPCSNEVLVTWKGDDHHYYDDLEDDEDDEA